MTAKHVYQAINAVTAALAQKGIGKGRRAPASAGGYAFRGIDDLQNVLAPLLAEHKLCVIPRVVERIATHGQTKSGTPSIHIALVVDVDFVSSVDGSMHTARVASEGADTSDKATNKAMSAAYKYASFQVFCVPTEGVDSETENPEVPNGSGPKKADADPIEVELTALYTSAKSTSDIAKADALANRYRNQKKLSPVTRERALALRAEVVAKLEAANGSARAS